MLIVCVRRPENRETPLAKRHQSRSALGAVSSGGVVSFATGHASLNKVLVMVLVFSRFKPQATNYPQLRTHLIKD